MAGFFVAGPRLVASFDRRGMVASFDRFAILGAEDAPVRRLDEVVVRTFGSAPRSAPVPSGRPSRYSRRRSESSPTFPIASMTYVPELGVVTTTPAFLNADIVRFHGSDWPGWCRPRCASPRFRRSRPGNCCRGRTGGREARGEIRVRYGIAPRFSRFIPRKPGSHHRVRPHDRQRLVHECLGGAHVLGWYRAHHLAARLGVHLGQDAADRPLVGHGPRTRRTGRRGR